MHEQFRGYTVTAVGIIGLNYQGSTVLADFCSVPVKDRPYGWVDLDYAAQVAVNPNTPPPLVLPILSTVSSPTHEGSVGPDVIHVYLYLVDPASERHEGLEELFGSVGEGCETYFYARGGELEDPPGQVDEVLLADFAASQEPADENDYETQPTLFISDWDYLLAFEGDLSTDEWKDYSVAIAQGDSGIAGFYGKARGAMYFGSSERGGFWTCDALLGYKQDFGEDVLDCGVERVEVAAGDYSADWCVQSRGDALFVIGHAAVDEDGSKYGLPGFVYGIHPFSPTPGHPSSVLTIDDWETSGLSKEVNWLITNACSLLGVLSWLRWQQLIPGRLDAICGFRGPCMRKLLPLREEHAELGPSAFFGGFSQKLTSNEGAHETLWKFDSQIPDDRAIIAWMENACEWARSLGADLPLSQHMMEEAAAIDIAYIYIIEWTYSRWDWPPLTASYYIVRY